MLGYQSEPTLTWMGRNTLRLNDLYATVRKLGIMPRVVADFGPGGVVKGFGRDGRSRVEETYRHFSDKPFETFEVGEFLTKFDDDLQPKRLYVIENSPRVQDAITTFKNEQRVQRRCIKLLNHDILSGVPSYAGKPIRVDVGFAYVLISKLEDEATGLANIANTINLGGILSLHDDPHRIGKIAVWNRNRFVIDYNLENHGFEKVSPHCYRRVSDEKVVLEPGQLKRKCVFVSGKDLDSIAKQAAKTMGVPYQEEKKE